jgi:hypothetical protein
MTDDEKYKLICFIEGDHTTFSVLAPRTANVYALREFIYKKREKGLFRDIDALDLALLKVCQEIYVIILHHFSISVSHSESGNETGARSRERRPNWDDSGTLLGTLRDGASHTAAVAQPKRISNTAAFLEFAKTRKLQSLSTQQNFTGRLIILDFFLICNF